MCDPKVNLAVSTLQKIQDCDKIIFISIYLDNHRQKNLLFRLKNEIYSQGFTL